jgi:hypothetical protein
LKLELENSRTSRTLKNTRKTKKMANGNRTIKLLVEGSQESKLTKFKYFFN